MGKAAQHFILITAFLALMDEVIYGIIVGNGNQYTPSDNIGQKTAVVVEALKTGSPAR
jgi:hypothetical protein